MGLWTKLAEVREAAFCVVLGFALTLFFILAFRGRRPPGPRREAYGNWVEETYGKVPVFLQMLIAAVALWAVFMTAEVVHHGYRY